MTAVEALRLTDFFLPGLTLTTEDSEAVKALRRDRDWYRERVADLERQMSQPKVYRVARMTSHGSGT